MAAKATHEEPGQDYCQQEVVHSQQHPTPYLKLKYDYIHPHILKSPNFPVVFKWVNRIYLPSRRSNDYEVEVRNTAMAVGNGDVASQLDLTCLRRQIRSTSLRLNWEKLPISRYPVQLIPHYRDDIHKRLRDSLTWLHDKGVSAQLEGRFGKIVWPDRVREETNLDIASLMKVAEKGGWFWETQFKNGIDSKSTLLLKKIHLQKMRKKETTYMFEIELNTGLNEDDSDIVTYNIRVKFDENGRPKIVDTRKGWRSRKLRIQFDIMCLQRKYDMRISLSSVEDSERSVFDPEPIHFLTSSIKKLESGVLRYDPQSMGEIKWRVVHIRYQEWESYEWRDQYTVDVSLVREYYVDPNEKCRDIKIEDYTEHHEVELHNAWDGLDADQFVNPQADPAPKPASQWDPMSIIEEFKRADFLGAMDELNAAMEDVQ